MKKTDNSNEIDVKFVSNKTCLGEKTYNKEFLSVEILSIFIG